MKWGDDGLLAILARVPWCSHGTARALCRRTRDLVRSKAFRKERLASGYTEHGVVVAGGDRSFRATAECWLHAGGRWRSIAPMSGPRADACSVVLDGELWVLSGCDSAGTDLVTVERWCPEANRWRSGPSVLEARYRFVAGVVGDSLVVAGGFGDAGRLASAEAFRPATGWTALPRMPYAVNLATSVVLGERLYVAGGAGGRDDGVNGDKLQVWDGTAWTLRADLPAARQQAASVAVDGKMWVIGGFVHGEGHSASVIVYDPETDRWTPGVPLPSYRSDCQATVEHTGCILLVGGQCGEEALPLRFQNGAWVETAVLPGVRAEGDERELQSPCVACVVLG